MSITSWSSTKRSQVEKSIRERNLHWKVTISVLLIGTWQFASLFFPSYVLPGVGEVLAATRTAITDPQFGSYVGNIFDTFTRLLIGFVISVVIGGVVGTLMGLRRNAETFFRSWVILGLSVPSIAVAFALIITIGISEWVPVLTVVVVGVPFVILNMWEGTQEMDMEITEMANFFGASRYQKFRHVIFPQLLQYVFPSMYWGLIISWKVLFIAEVFGAGSGIGYVVNYWFQQQRVDMLLGWILIPMILIVVAQKGLRVAEHRILVWR